MQLETKQWLKGKVFPLWTREGIDPKTNLFVESLSFEGQPLAQPIRGLVQARQIYSFFEGVNLNVLDAVAAKSLVQKSAEAFLQYYGQPNGSIIHSVQPDGKVANSDLDFYTQAFAIFGMAYAFQLTGDQKFKQAAEKNMNYLLQERRNPAGGFTEIKNNQVMYQSNPHMHLFEAVLTWMRIDPQPLWEKTAKEIKTLCLEKFIDSKAKKLAEHFDQNWNPLRNEQGHFIFEPGHQYEWAWLMYNYGKIFNEDTSAVAQALFKNAETEGLSPDKTLAYDEVWSNGLVHKSSSRFWPQTERIKAAAILRETKVADLAMKSLIENFLLMDKGLWKDTLIEKNQYGDQPAKASSLYHIINAIAEYVKIK